MSELTLVIGNKNYSSWSLRAWLYLALNKLDFNEVRLPLDTPEFYERIDHFSPSRKVPALVDGDIHVWDSLAIIEYLQRQYPAEVGWPAGREQQARALSAVMEMHSGFPLLRSHYPMNCRMAPFRAPLLHGVERDLERLDTLWREALEDSGGPGLFGALSIADIFYAPVVFRCHTYQLPLSDLCRDYVARMLKLPALQSWARDAAAESEVVAQDEFFQIHPELAEK